MLQREVHLRNYINIIRRHDFVIAASFLLVFGSAFVVSLYLPKSYEASTLIELKKTSSRSSTSSANLFRNILSGGIEQGEMETLRRRFTTESLLKSTISKLENQNVEGVKYLPSVRKLKKCIYPEIVPDTRYIKLSVRLEEEEGGERNAAILANSLVEQIQEIRRNEKVIKAKYRKDILKKKLDELKRQIITEEENLQNFMKKSGIPMIWQAKFSKLLERRSELIKTRQQIENSKLAAELELKKLEQELEKYSPELVEYSETVSDSPIWVEQVNELEELKFKIAGLKTRFGEDSPELQSLEAQKKEREKRLEELSDSKRSVSKTEKKSPTSPIYMSLIDRKISVEIRKERAEHQLKGLDERIREIDLNLENLIGKLPENQFQFDKISRDVRFAYDMSKEVHKQMISAELAIAEVAIDENAYEDLEVDTYEDLGVAKIQSSEAAIDKAVYENPGIGRIQSRGGIKVIDVAYPEKIPVSPRIRFISAIAGIVGLAVGLTAAFMLEYFDNTYKTPDDVQSELELDILGVIPKSRSENVYGQSLEASVIESYDILASNVNFACLGDSNKLIMLTSSTQGEGKSGVIANLGISMAKSNNKVLIVDADLRRGIQHKFFALSSKPGLTELLSKDTQKTVDETIQTTEYSNLDLLPTGLIPPNPIELLSSNNMIKLIKELESSYDVILFDTTPIFPVADALVLASKLDNCILIVDLDKTPRDTVIRAKEQLKKVDINSVGLICNRVKDQKFNMY